MADLCCMVGCNSLGTKSCAACGAVKYCSKECQKEDWKMHKDSCIDIKKLPTTFLSMVETTKCVKKINAQIIVINSQRTDQEVITIMLRCLAFDEHQYGVPVEGTSQWRRSNGDLVDNLNLINIRMNIAEFYYNVLYIPDSALAHAIEARQMLEHREKSNEKTLILLVKVEERISSSHLMKQQFDAADHHCQQSLMFARLIKGEGRVGNEIKALKLLASIQLNQFRYPEAIEFAEQAYILLSEAYGPVHPDVQQAAAQLIGCLISNKDYSRADNYCRKNLENLTDPRNGVDQESIEVAQGIKQIADIWLEKPPVDDEKAAFALAEEAEDMARKSCSIAITEYGTMSRRCTILADVFMKRGKYTDETRMVLKQALALVRQYLGRKGMITIRCLQRLVHFHDHVSGTMPPGDARDRELQLRDECFKEIDSLSVR